VGEWIVPLRITSSCKFVIDEQGGLVVFLKELTGFHVVTLCLSCSLKMLVFFDYDVCFVCSFVVVS